MKLERPSISLVESEEQKVFFTIASETLTNLYKIIDFGTRPIFYSSANTIPNLNFDEKTTIKIVNTNYVVDKLLNNFFRGQLIEYTVNDEKSRLSEDPDLEVRYVVSEEQEHNKNLIKRLKDSEINFLRSIASGKGDFESSFNIFLPRTNLRCEIIVTANNEIWNDMVKKGTSYFYYLGEDFKKSADDLVQFIKEKV